MVGAEMPMMSDQVVWSEQNRLHISYEGVSCQAFGGAQAGNRLTLPVTAGANTNVRNVTDWCTC